MPSDVCAECRTEIATEHRLPGPRAFGWYSQTAPPGAVLTRCPGCLAVSAVWPESGYSGGSLPRREQPELFLGSADVARAIETLRGFDARGNLREGVAQLRHSWKPSCLLRVPEVFAIARGAFGGAVTPVFQGAFRVTGRAGTWYPRTSAPLIHDAHRKWPDDDRSFRAKPGDPSIELPTYYPREHASGPTRDDDVPQGVSEVDGDDPFARIRRTDSLRVLRGQGVFLEVVPLESEWVTSGVLSCFRLAADRAIPTGD